MFKFKFPKNLQDYRGRNFQWFYIIRVACIIHNYTGKSFIWSKINQILKVNYLKL